MAQIDPAARAAMLVPDSTRANYIDEVKRAAVARGITADAARGELVKQWRATHDNDPLGGWDVLADWLEGADLSALDAVDPHEAEKVRALESLKRDPQTQVLDMSDKEVRGEVEKARRAAASRTGGKGPVRTEAGEEVPDSEVDARLKDGKTKQGDGKATSSR